MNTKNPNSFRNAIPVCVFSCKDNPANREAAPGLYRSQLEKLSSSEWESGSGCKFKIKILLCGDDEFLTTLYGCLLQVVYTRVFSVLLTRRTCNYDQSTVCKAHHRRLTHYTPITCLSLKQEET